MNRSRRLNSVRIAENTNRANRFTTPRGSTNVRMAESSTSSTTTAPAANTTIRSAITARMLKGQTLALRDHEPLDRGRGPRLGEQRAQRAVAPEVGERSQLARGLDPL